MAKSIAYISSSILIIFVSFAFKTQRMKLLQLIYSLSLLSFLYSCSKNEVEGDGTTTVLAKTLLNVPYGNDPKQKMDIYLPAGRSADSTKTMILLHGGAWIGGDKTDFDSYIDSLKNRLPDYAFFNVNYRLSAGDTINKFPTQENDVRFAVNHILGKALDYQTSNSKIILLGASAGAHLAMLQAYKDTISIRPKAVVSFFGPSDLLDMYNNPVGGNVALRQILGATIGKTPTQNMAIYVSSSPVTYIKTSSAPTILLHGGVDPLVSPSQSTKVRDLLTTAGVPNQYVFYPTGGHGDWNNATFSDAFSKIQTFLRANVR
jgi:acetyl esterase/lipase